MIRKPLIPVLLLFTVLCAGCGPSYQFKKAQQLEEKGYFVEAGLKYEEIFDRYPNSPSAPEALYRLGKLYQKKLKLYSQATRYYTKLVERYPKSEPWTRRALLGAFNSPDYFPLTSGSFWIEGDSETGGQNMRAEWNCVLISTETFAIQKRIFAGHHLVTEIKRIYRKDKGELHEYEALSGPYGTTLSYPYFEGKTWDRGTSGHLAKYTVVSKTAAIRVKAGEFPDCLKVKEQNPLVPGSVKYNYFAPGVGWVLTTTAAADGPEHRNTELLSYKVFPEP